MLDSDLDRLDQWIRNLEGPGIFSLGQPIFAAQAGFFGRFADWNLPDFEQYADLVRVLASSRHSLVLLTGDVHYGRIASCLLPSGLELIEIISSPTALVDKSVGGKWHAPRTSIRRLIFPE